MKSNRKVDRFKLSRKKIMWNTSCPKGLYLSWAKNWLFKAWLQNGLALFSLLSSGWAAQAPPPVFIKEQSGALFDPFHLIFSLLIFIFFPKTHEKEEENCWVMTQFLPLLLLIFFARYINGQFGQARQSTEIIVFWVETEILSKFVNFHGDGFCVRKTH